MRIGINASFARKHNTGIGQVTVNFLKKIKDLKSSEGLAAGAIAEAVGCPHNTFSTHVAILARAGLVRGTREGRTIIYRADLAGMRALIAFLVRDCCDGHPELCNGLSGLVAETGCGCPAASSSKRRLKRK